jgi:hypothetical protein
VGQAVRGRQEAGAGTGGGAAGRATAVGLTDAIACL